MKRSRFILLAFMLFYGLLSPAAEGTKKKASSSKSAKPGMNQCEQKAREVCMMNILVISQAVYLYNLDNSPRLTDIFNGDACDPIGFLVKRKALKHPIQTADTRCCYRSHGNLTAGGIIVCDYHGSNAEVPKMKLHGLAEAPIIDGEQLAVSGGIDLKVPLLPDKIKLKSENDIFLPEQSHASADNNNWRPKWPPAEANDRQGPPSVAPRLINGKYYYNFIQAPEGIFPESVEEHNREQKDKESRERCRKNLLQLSDALKRFRADHPDAELIQLNKNDYSTFAGFLVKQGYLSFPIADECYYRLDSFGKAFEVFCPRHGYLDYEFSSPRQ